MEKRKIIIADDDISTRQFVSTLLAQTCIVLEAEDGKQVLTMAQNEQPSVILVNMNLPKIDGLTACYTLKTNPAMKRLPVIILDSACCELDERMCGAFGADGYLTEPLDADRLVEMVTKFLNRPQTCGVG